MSGDLHLIKPFDAGILIAVVDGVGHGDEATAAAAMAVATLTKHVEEPLNSLVRRCHQALAGTRGAVMTIVSISTIDHTLAWLGVGNVEARLFRGTRSAGRPAESVLLRSGLVGFQLPVLQTAVVNVSPGDLLVLATDGVHNGFEAGINPDETPERISRSTLDRYFKGTDDALVLAARYLGRRS